MLAPRAGLLVVFLLFIPPHAEATEAVVLSGGGSLGIAHAGALIGIERRGHDPDLVLGASMGAIVGALYAAGYSSDSIAAIMVQEDWRGIFTPVPVTLGPTRALRYPAVHLQRGGGGWILRGFVSDWRINRELVRRLFPASARARGDFDRLPRRFRSVAADLETGALVPLGFGDLARSVRASMASPGFYAPIRWGTRMLTDGGVNDYLPVDEARRLGADLVIAVDVLRPPPHIHSLDAVMVADRSLRLVALRARSGGAQPDVRVLPVLNPALTGMAFPVDPSPFLRAGLNAALRDVPAADEKRATRAIPSEPLILGPLTVETPGSPLGPFVGKAFRSISGTSLDAPRIFERMDRLYATGLFDGIWPSVEDTTSSENPAWVVRAETVSRISAAGAVGFDNDRGGRIWGTVQGIGVQSSMPVQLGLEGIANGIEHMGAISLRLPSLGNPPTAWSAGGVLGETRIPFLAPDLAGGDPEVRRSGGWFGAEWLRIQPAIEAAATFRAERIRSDAGPRGDSFGPAFRLGAVPRLVEVIGTPASLEAEARFGDVRYRRARVKGSVARSAGPVAVALLGDVEAASGDVPLDAAPAMGTDFLVPAMRWGERRGKARAVAGLDLAYSVPLGTLRARLRGGITADEMRVDGSFGREKDWLGGAGLSGLWWTPYGRVEAGFEAGTLGDRRVLVRLGQDF